MRDVQGVGGIAVARGRAAALAALVCAVVVASDLAAKAAVRDLLAPNESVPLIPGVLWLTHVRNTGAAFGMLQGLRWIFILVSVVAVIGIAVHLVRGRTGPWWSAVALGLVAGGSLGNLHDRLLLARVTDFIDFRWFPVFNIADSAISVGVTVLVIALLFAGDEDGEDGAAEALGEQVQASDSGGRE